jgi:hypothetical protein
MGNPALFEMGLSDVRVIMTIMHVLVVKPLCQVGMGRILVLECMLPGTRGPQRLHPVLSGIEWRFFPRILAPRPLTRY